MSRVEPKEQRRNEQPREHAGRDGQQSQVPSDHTPSKAEGDEATIDEALRRQER